MSNIQLLLILVNKLGLPLNSIKLMKLLGTPKPSNKMEELVELNQLTETVLQFIQETEKLPTLSLTKDPQDIKLFQLLQLLQLWPKLERTPKLKLNTTIFGSKNLLFHHTIKWTTPGPTMNSIKKMRLSGTNKPNLKSMDQIMPIQLTETVPQFMEETVMQLIPTLT